MESRLPVEKENSARDKDPFKWQDNASTPSKLRIVTDLVASQDPAKYIKAGRGPLEGHIAI